MLRFLVAIALCGALGCRPEPPAYDPLHYLAIGVDPTAEAEVERRALVQRGYRLEARVDGRGFVALGARSLASGTSAVRIVTRNGVVLGIDAPIRDRPTWRRVELLERPGGVDLDGDPDGHPEVLVRVDDSHRPAPCIVVVRVRSASRGDAFEVPVDARAHGARACPEEIGDVDRDGNAELLVGHRPFVVQGAPVPRLLVPYVAHEGRFVAGSEALLRDLALAQIGAARQELALARGRGDRDEILRLACEIAWYERASGRAAHELREELEGAVAGQALDEPRERLLGLVRASLAG